MSHFVCLAILPEGTSMEDAQSAAAQLLAPYDEHLEFPPRQTDCWCVGSEARKAVEAEMEEKCPIMSLRGKFASLPRKDRTQSHWTELLKPRIALEKRLMQEHPLKDMSDAECPSCGATGVCITCSNPHAKWDWWVIGGRWDGWIFGPEREKALSDAKGASNSEDDQPTQENNCRPVRDIPIDDAHYCPFAVITPDGEWHESGSMGWWGVVSDEKEVSAWHEEVKVLLAQYPDCLAVAVDCHV
jgi:hypothetical protein